MKKNILYILSFALLLGLFSCETEVPEPWMSNTADYDGNWYARYDSENLGEDWGGGYYENFTYNTSSNSDTIFIEDAGNFWDYKVKVPVNATDLTFGSTDTVIDMQYGVKVVLRNGIIVKDAVTVPSALVVDSIYYEVWIEDLDAIYGTGYMYVGGIRKTGFDEDHP